MKRNQTLLERGWLFTDKPVSDAEKANCDTGAWSSVSLPHDWAIARSLNKDMLQGGPQGFLDRWGIGWYRYNLPLQDKKKHCRYLLTFDGVYENSTVWVNETAAGGRLYGYSGFTIDITPLIKAGDNLIAVRADNTGAPVDRWYSGAGIYRKVVFTEVHETHVEEENIVINTKISPDYKKAVLSIDTGLTQAKVKAELLDGGVPIVKSENDGGQVSLEIPDAKLWSASNPYLYKLVLTLHGESQEEMDSITLSVGIRDIAFLPRKGMLVNGNPEKLKGVCLHHDVSGAGSAVTKSLLRQRLEVFKKLGCNAIRTSHNTPAVELLDLCDEMGFYVIDESFDKWDTGAYGRYYATDWEKDLSYMVKRDRNRACVVIWSVGNEVEAQGSSEMLDKLKLLVKTVKALDTRPVICAMSPHYTDRAGNTVETIEEVLPTLNEIASCVDIMALNYQEQWYDNFHRANPDKLIVGSETYLFFKGNRNNYFNFSTENPWMDVERNDYVLGGFLWAGVDYLGESMGYPCKGWCAAMVKSNHERKPISWLFESYWSDDPVVHITMQDYTIRDNMEREHWSTPRLFDCWNFPMYARSPIPYMIFTNCQEIRICLNGKYYNLKKPSECEGRILTGYLPYEAGTITAEGFIDGKKVCEHQLKTAKEAAKLVFSTDKQYLKSESIQQLLLTVHAVDQDGVPCMRESAEVRFSIQGDSIIECVDNGDMLGSEPFASDRIHLYQGAASVILRTKPVKGRIVVNAYADGMQSGAIELILE